MGGGEQAHQFSLNHVGVLVFVYHDVSIAIGKTPPYVFVKLHQLAQPKQQIVIIEHAAFALIDLILLRQCENLTLMFEQMRKIDFELVLERSVLVARHTDRFGDSALLGEAPFFRTEPHPAAQQIENVLHVGAVEDGEIWLQADNVAVTAQNLVGERMEGAAANLTAALTDQLLDPAQHLLGGAAGKREEENCAGRHSALDQSRDTIDKGSRLARTGARDHQQRAVAMDGRGELLRIEHFSVTDAELALVRLRNGQRVFKNDYLLGHGGPSLA